jgi:hypothetical protein
MDTLFFRTTHPDILFTGIHKVSAARPLMWILAILFAVLFVFAPNRAGAGDPHLSELKQPITLNAIARSDNGKAVGMQVTLGDSYLSYKAFKGKLALKLGGKFDARKITLEQYRKRSGPMDGAALYRILNGAEFVSSNPQHRLLSSKGPPTFVTIKYGAYPDGRDALWICVFSAPSAEEFYRTLLGHERCDAFR